MSWKIGGVQVVGPSIWFDITVREVLLIAPFIQLTDECPRVSDLIVIWSCSNILFEAFIGIASNRPMGWRWANVLDVWNKVGTLVHDSIISSSIPCRTEQSSWLNHIRTVQTILTTQLVLYSFARAKHAITHMVRLESGCRRRWSTLKRHSSRSQPFHQGTWDFEICCFHST